MQVHTVALVEARGVDAAPPGGRLVRPRDGPPHDEQHVAAEKIDATVLGAESERALSPVAAEGSQRADAGLRLGHQKSGEAPGSEPFRLRLGRGVLEDAMEAQPGPRRATSPAS